MIIQWIYDWRYVLALFAFATFGLACVGIFMIDHEIERGRVPEDDFYRWRKRGKKPPAV